MPSPFPGMDPYIESPRIWRDFHNDLPAEIRSALNQIIQPRYVAQLIPYVTYEVVEVAAKRKQTIEPDLGIWHPQSSKGEFGGAAVLIPPAPVESLVPLEIPLRYASIEITAVDTMELVTAIEILSPVNKRPSHEAYRDYQRKRRELLRSSVNLLEIDLLRGGQRPPLEKPVPPAPYYVVLSRAEWRPTVEVWPIQLADKLPVLPVPLLEPDPDVPLDLGAAVASVYERGGYGTLIDYSQPPPPPALEAADAAWLQEQLQQQGRI